MKNQVKNLMMSLAVFAAAIISFGTSSQVSAQGSFHGAIFTSNGDGTTVNQNRYASKADVYLNGGPQNASANGLPDGTYYFQVTDPSGATLLSTDPAVCRQLTVANGVVSSASINSPAECRHLNGTFNQNNGSTPVQLLPFADTPNNGGEYKVWLIRQATTTTIGSDGIILNFNNSNAKTDNFKVESDDPTCVPEEPECPLTVSIGGTKFYDANANGTEQENEVGVEGVRIEVTLSSSPDPIIVETDVNGNWSLANITPGTTYSVRELLPCVDDNGDGTCDPGHYWVQTAPVADSNGFQGYTGTANTDVSGLDFGNICFGPNTTGRTLGFWSNKNGQGIMQEGANNFANSLTYLRGLNLKTYNKRNPSALELDFDPANYTSFRTWLLDGNAVSMAYMLSVQFAVSSLDVRYGFFTDGQIVDARSLGLGLTSIGNVRGLANTSLNDHQITITGDPHRQSQEIMKNFFDGINNNRLGFASAEACSVFYSPLPE